MSSEGSSIRNDGRSPISVFSIFLRLGLTSFGGPIAHLGYFRDEFVVRRKWISDASYADLVALCQFLPGPTSSQVGLALGLSRAGYLGALAAWTGFTLPSAILLIVFALGLASFENTASGGLLHGLKVVAVAVVAQAVWGMARNLCTDVARITIMTASVCFVLLVPTVWSQVGAIVIAGVCGLLLFKPEQQVQVDGDSPIAHRSSLSLLWISIFFLLLVGLPLVALKTDSQLVDLVDAFYRAGALVFGGGHVVLPLLQSEVVPPGWVNNDAFLAGYGAAQAVPGPLFTFAAFLGASMNQTPSGWLGGIVCLLAIFAPSFFLVAGVLPYWDRLRQNISMRAALAGVNAAVVGLLLAVLYQPVWLSAIFTAQDFTLALVALIALMFWKWPPWLVVLACGAAGWLVTVIS